MSADTAAVTQSRKKTLDNVIEKIDNGLHYLVGALAWLGAAAMVIMTLLVTANVIGRFGLKTPVLGSVEMTSLLLVVIVFCSLAYTEYNRSHIKVDLVLVHFPVKVQRIILGAGCIIGAVYFTLVGWQGLVQMQASISPLPLGTSVLSIPYAPFYFLMSFGFFVLALELIVHTFRPAIRHEKRGQGEVVE